MNADGTASFTLNGQILIPIDGYTLPDPNNIQVNRSDGQGVVLHLETYDSASQQMTLVESQVELDGSNACAPIRVQFDFVARKLP